MIDSKTAILQVLVESDASAEEVLKKVAGVVELKSSSVQRVLLTLTGLGLISRTRQRRKRGRPHYRYSLTDAGIKQAIDDSHAARQAFKGDLARKAGIARDSETP
jgi:predicted transcriptional regulator